MGAGCAAAIKCKRPKADNVEPLQQSGHRQLLKVVSAADDDEEAHDLVAGCLPTRQYSPAQQLCQSLLADSGDSGNGCGSVPNGSAIEDRSSSTYRSESISRPKKFACSDEYSVASSTASFGEGVREGDAFNRQISEFSVASGSIVSSDDGSVDGPNFAKRSCRRRPKPLLVPIKQSEPVITSSSSLKPWEVQHRRESHCVVEKNEVAEWSMSTRYQEQCKKHALPLLAWLGKSRQAVDPPTVTARTGAKLLSTSGGDQHHLRCASKDLETTQNRRQSVQSEQGSFSGSRQMLLVFDWDDTLCPTHLISTDPRLNWAEMAPCFKDETMPLEPDSDSSPQAEGLLVDALRRHVEVVRVVLQAACSIGRVVIVTLAQTGWVETSARHFLPGLNEVLEELQIEVIYARTCLKRYEVFNAIADEMDVYMMMKQAAIATCIRKLRSKNCMIENVMTIGDAPIEHEALKELSWVTQQKWQCKTLKMEQEPSLQQLTTQLDVLAFWIQPLFLLDGDSHVDLSDSKDYSATCAMALKL